MSWHSNLDWFWILLISELNGLILFLEIELKYDDSHSQEMMEAQN